MEAAKAIVRAGLKRRTVTQISQYLEPKQIYELITRTVGVNECRDTAMQSMCYASGGRISSVVGGNKLKIIDGKEVKVGKYEGVKRSNITLQKEGLILVKEMDVCKRSERLIAKYGKQVSIRDEFAIPLKTKLFDNPYWNQLVPFGLLILEYLVKFDPQDRLFPYERGNAWLIIRNTTGMFPNWFRAQAEHFYGHYLFKDSVKLAKFLKVVRPEQTAHYIGFSWKDQLKNTERSMDFDWIQKESNLIIARMKK